MSSSFYYTLIFSGSKLSQEERDALFLEGRRNFLSTEHFLSLSHAELLRYLRNDAMDIADEHELFQAILRWAMLKYSNSDDGIAAGRGRRPSIKALKTFIAPTKEEDLMKEIRCGLFSKNQWDVVSASQEAILLPLTLWENNVLKDYLAASTIDKEKMINEGYLVSFNLHPRAMAKEEKRKAASGAKAESGDKDGAGPAKRSRGRPIGSARKKANGKKASTWGGGGRGRPKKVEEKELSSGAEAAKVQNGKGRGRGRPAAPAKNGSKKTPVKRGRDISDESESEAASSRSEYGKKATPTPKKRAATAKKTPKAAAQKAASPVESNRARRGRPAAKAKSYKELSEVELEISEDEKKPVSKRAKLELKKKEKKVSEDEDEMSVLKDDEGTEKEKVAKNNENGTVEKKKVEKDSEPEDDDKKSDKSHADSEEEPKEKSPAIDEEEEKSGQKQLKNRTDTDYSKIDFECDKKTADGDPWNLKIACWNIGGSNAWIKKNGLEYLKKEDPDVMCLVEVKFSEKSKPEEVETVDGYPHLYLSYNAENSGQSGVAILSKTEAKSVEYGLSVGDSDSDEDKKTKESLNKEGSLITLEYENHYLINAYVPNSGRPEKTDDFPKGYPPKVASGERQKFDKLFRSHVQELEKKKPVIVTGDLNVCHQEIDLANPKTNDKSAGFTKEEREGMTQLLDETTLIDSFRTLYPDKKETYTFWSDMNNFRQKNIGWRLDYFLVSKKLQDSVCENLMRTEVFGSDHCPIVLFLKI